MASRKVEDCVPALQGKIKLFDAAMKAAGIPYIITCTARIINEQIALYAQGREDIEHVNILRRAAGMLPLPEKEDHYKITWTLHSKHIIDLDDGRSDNDQSRAFDIVITKNGKPSYDLKVDVNESGHPDYDEAGAIGESVGLKWGGRFKKPDRPHFEI